MDYEKGHVDALTGLIFAMTHPKIDEPLSLASVERWQAALAAPDTTA